jgi:hypothetical protein
MLLDIHVPEHSELRGVIDSEVFFEEFSDGLPMSVIVDSHVFISELNNQFDKSGPVLEMLEKVHIRISLSNLTFDVGGQLFFGSFNLIFHGVSVDVFPLGNKEIVKGSIGDFNLLPQFLNNIDV